MQNPETSIVTAPIPQTISLQDALEAMQAEIERTNTRLHEVATLCATVEQERDAALARLAELEKQEPVIYQAKTKPGFLSTSAYAWEDCEKADFLVYEADGVHVRGLYAAAGASLVATPIVAWAKSTPRKLRITTMDMGREDGWRPLGYTAAGASPVQPLTKTQIEKGMMALLWCAASDLERLNPNMYEGYKDDVTRVYSAITTETTRN